MAASAVMPTRGGLTIRDGIVGGIIAGTAFILAEMFFSQMLGKPFLSPPRLISTIVLGQAAATPGYQAIPSSVIVGLVIHYLLSMLFGIITTSIAWFSDDVRRSDAGGHSSFLASWAEW
ncbi:MAG: hypothetical protein GIX03_02125 [Candidatus Eremiobacteraeota bacterium]|nr:hypothetical protein [Candidatus Eremiobacteraeota bacterium]MBC5801815.1 hypothetical protein [Candidatus Eremiobacteraeota bacterium]MBC5821027.1 hypothetical protein [Candidatus Eremiobacteraeota bacterium]